MHKKTDRTNLYSQYCKHHITANFWIKQNSHTYDIIIKDRKKREFPIRDVILLHDNAWLHIAMPKFDKKQRICSRLHY